MSGDVRVYMAVGLAVLGMVCVMPSGNAQEKPPQVWMIPPGINHGEAFRQLMLHPDQWKETMSRITGIGYADHVLNQQFTDEELKAWLPTIHQHGLQFGLEVGAVKEWGPTGAATFKAESPMWDRFQRLGGHIDSIAMDEPLCCVRQAIKKPDSYAVDETANFIALVRQHYPDIKIGDIEPYPYIPEADLVTWIDALQAKLKQMNVRGLDFMRLDVDWAYIIIKHQGNWSDVKSLELACRARKLPFSLIYWAADYPALQRMGLADDETWYTSIMAQGYAYALVGGKPDEDVIESWVNGPETCLPETDEWTFTRSVRDFCRRFAKPPDATANAGK